MATNRITVKVEGDAIIVTSNDINIKQVFMGFGSWGTGSGKREYPEFYGRSIETDKSVRADDEMWQWDLTMELVKHLYQVITDDLDYRQKSEREGEWVTPKADDDVLKTLGNIIAGTLPEPLDAFTEAYITASLWSTNDESTPSGGEPLDDNYGVSDIAPEAMAKIKADCARFQEENRELLEKAYETYVSRDGFSGAALAGHDFWLTRCGHGVGFWDRGLGEIGKALTKASKAFGECWIEVGDDGQLHGF
jgi:hypothetical protein